MQMFLDSAKADEIKYALEHWNIDGLTTNPRHIQASGQPLDRVIGQIAELFEGTKKPVSVEVNPRLTEVSEIVAAGKELATRSPNFVVKVGASEAGFEAIRRLSQLGIRTNATLVFHVAQAWHAARCGATYVSPFVGWKETYGDGAETLIAEIVTMLEVHDYPTQIIAAAMRNTRQISIAAQDGAHCATAGMDVWRESFRSPYTDMGHELFGTAWDATDKS